MTLLAVSGDTSPGLAPEQPGIENLWVAWNGHGGSTEGRVADRRLEHIEASPSPVVDSDISGIAVALGTNPTINVFGCHLQQFLKCGTDAQISGRARVCRFKEFPSKNELGAKQWILSPEPIEGHHC